MIVLVVPKKEPNESVGDLRGCPCMPEDLRFENLKFSLKSMFVCCMFGYMWCNFCNLFHILDIIL